VADIAYDPLVAFEFEHSARNAAIAWLMKSFGNFHNDVATVLQNYFHYCSLEMSCVNWRGRFCFSPIAVWPRIWRPGYCPNPVAAGECLNDDQRDVPERRRICLARRLPAKSGVGGGIVAIVPQEMAIAVWSPELDAAGNSLAGSRCWKS
jgi:glutaminase